VLLFQGILLLITFVALVVYSFKGGNLLIGFVVTAALWCLILWLPFSPKGDPPGPTWVKTVFQDSVANYGGTIAIIVFGAWFGKVIVDTGIAGSIIKKVVELAGDKAFLTTILLVIVSTAIFTSAFGVGSVLAIGMIVLPIMFSVGVKKNIALAAYMFSVAGGMWMNIAYVSQFNVFWKNADGVAQEVYKAPGYIPFALVATAIHLCMALLFVTFWHFRNRAKVRKAWPATEVLDDIKMAPWWSFIVPFVPVVLVAVFKWQAVPSFLVGIFLGLLLTGHMNSWKKLVDISQKTLHDGVADVGLLIGMLYGVNIFQAAAAAAAPVLKSLLGGVVPTNPWVLVIAFAILAPLAIFRGPLMVFGSGGATIAILQAIEPYHSHPWILLSLFIVFPVAIVANTCPTQSWGMWGLSYAKVEPRTYLTTGIPWAWALALVVVPISYMMIGRL